MGLIKAALGAAGGTLADQWKEFFYCDALDKNVLVKKGQKRTSSRSSNTKGEDNIISNGSLIAVADGQCMMIVEQGKIVEVCAEPGEFTYDTSTEPSIFAGSLGESIKQTFMTVGKRFTFGGDTAKDQRIYYFNTKELGEILFGTATPIPFRVVVSEELGYKLSVDLRCNGQFTYKIADPLIFYTNVCGNVEQDYESSELDARLKSELLAALQPALAKLSANKIQYYELPAHTLEIGDALNEVLSKSWTEARGLKVETVSINSISVPDDQRQKITEWEENAMTVNPNTAAARLVGGQIDAMKAAASNSNGAMTGFMGMGMAMNAGGMSGMSATNLYAMGQQQQMQGQYQQPMQGQPMQGQYQQPMQGQPMQGQYQQPMQAQQGAVVGGAVQAGAWTCSCGAQNTGKFCQNCGSKNPSAGAFRCDKCGWTPTDPNNIPKFCPECGDPFNDADRV